MKPSAAKLNRTIASAYFDLALACERSREAGDLLSKALAAAIQGEREHRAMGARFTGAVHKYACGVERTARWFVLKWFLEERKDDLVSFRAAAQLRPDCFYSYALRCLFVEEGWETHIAPEEASLVLAVDYAGDIAL